MEKELDRKFIVLNQILSGEVELFNISDLPKIVNERYRPIVVFIIERNREGKAPSIKEIIDSRIKYSAHNYRKKITTLIKTYVMVNPSITQYAALLERWEGGRISLRSGPKNVRSIVEDRTRSSSISNKRSYNWRKAKKTAKYIQHGVPTYSLALFYDEDGPVYRACFPELDLGFVPAVYSP